MRCHSEVIEHTTRETRWGGGVRDQPSTREQERRADFSYTDDANGWCTSDVWKTNLLKRAVEKIDFCFVAKAQKTSLKMK